MSHEESISLEETNKIRISLGLKPLTDDKAPADNKEKQAEDNYAKRRQQEAQERERKRIQDGIAKVKNKRELNASLKGATLGDADADGDDTLKWIKKSKKRERELARKRQEEQEKMDKQFQGDDYTEKDLEGLKVAHDLEELDEGEERILTLKDSRILDNEEDELQNVEMAEHERTKKRNELKIKKRDYTGYDDDEFTAGQIGMRRQVLSKYDEELEGSNETGFRLGGSAPKSTKETRQEQQEEAAKVNKSLLSIDYAKNIETTDYLKEGDIGFKKPKTKKKRSSRRQAEDSGIEPTSADGMDVDVKPLVPVRNLDANFVDDDDLQASLARARRAKTMRKPVIPTQEEIARRLAEERSRSQPPVDAAVIDVDDIAEAADGDGGLTFDDTSEFVRAISYNPAQVKKEPDSTQTIVKSEPRQASEPVKAEDVEMEELEAGEVPVKEEEEDEEAMLHALEAAINSAETDETKVKKEEADLQVGTSSEQRFSQGMAATLNILRQQGVLAAPSADQSERERVQRQRDLWLSEYRTLLAKRELDRLKSRGEKKDQAQREYENRLREQQEAREGLELFKDYKPDVNIVYHDEFGRELTPKEAWKALSHKFHGKTSGKMKTEKRLKKIQEERKKEAMASGDTPLSMNRAFQMRQEKTGQAHFVLSVGTRDAVPQAAEFLDPPTLSKGKTEKVKNKKKNTKEKAPVVDANGFTTFIPIRQLSASGSPEPSGSQRHNGDSPAPSMMRPSFSQVSEPASGTGTPVSGERTKVAFGFGTKRKAGEEGSGTPPTKRR